MIKENQSLFNKFNIITDVLILFGAMVLSYVLRFSLFPVEEGYVTLRTYIQFTVLIVPVQLLIYGFFDLYSSFRTKSIAQECARLIEANIVLTAVLLSVLFVFKMVNISRWLIVTFFFVNVTLVIAKRVVLRKTLSRVRAKGYNLKSLILIGSGEIAREYLGVLKKNQGFGYHYCGYISNKTELEGTRLGGYSDLYQVLENKKPDEVICAMDVEDSDYLESVVSDCEKTGTKISIIPFCYKYIPSRPYIDQMDGIPLVNVRRIPLDNLANAFIKRTMDIMASALMLLVLSPVFCITALLVRLTSPGPAIFKQQRVGLNKKLFTMYKFRSMRVNNASDTAWSTNQDDRRTKFGSFIRKFSIDELPQLWNVLKGDMSLVGPRPELPHFVDTFKEKIPLYMVKHQVKPGITGLAQIKGYRGDTSIRKRIEYDIEYIENWNFFLDIQILFLTIFRGFKNNETL